MQMKMDDEKKAFEPKNILDQPDPLTWLRYPPKKLRGDMKGAFQMAAEADTYECTCWNKKCPYHGDCRKCIVFHMALKQFPTCQRAMLEEMHLTNLIDEALHVERDENGKIVMAHGVPVQEHEPED